MAPYSLDLRTRVLLRDWDAGMKARRRWRPKYFGEPSPGCPSAAAATPRKPVFDRPPRRQTRLAHAGPSHRTWPISRN